MRRGLSTRAIDRRQFLTLGVAGAIGALVPLGAGTRATAAPAGAGETRKSTYEVAAAILYGALRYRAAGTIEEHVDRGAGRYEVKIAGQGTGLANRSEAAGVRQGERWVPVRSASRVSVAGREGRSRIAYDYERRAVAYQARSETFFLGRVRTVDDVVPIPAGVHVDDVVSALLNLGDGVWRPEAGALQTRMVRRQRVADDGPAEVDRTFRAEIVPVRLAVAPAPGGGRTEALFDLHHFSTWALPRHPARLVFGPEGRPELITARLMFGTSLTIRFGA